MAVSSAAAVKPTMTTITVLQPKLNTTEISYNKIVSIQKRGIKLNDLSSNIFIVPHNGANYIIRNPVKPSSIPNTGCKPVEQKQLILTNIAQLRNAKKVYQFIMRVQSLSDGTYKMLAPPGQIPASVENLFNPNSHFIKQNTGLDFLENKRKLSYFVPTSSVNTKKINHVPKDSRVLSEETNYMKILSGSYNKIENNNSNSRSFISIDEMKKMFPKVINTSKVVRSQNNKIPPSEEIKKARKQIIPLNEACKMIDSKQVTPISKSDIQHGKDQELKKTPIDQNMILPTLKSSKNQKIQLLLPSVVGSEKKALNDNIDGLNKLVTPYSKPPKNNKLKNKTHLESPRQVITKVSEGSLSLELFFGKLKDQQKEVRKKIISLNEACKMIDSKQVAPISKSDIQHRKDQELKKPPIDQNMILPTLKSRINKKNQLLLPSIVGPEKKALNDNIDGLNKLETLYRKPQKENKHINNTHLKSPRQMITKVSEGSLSLELFFGKQKDQQMQFEMKKLYKRNLNNLYLKRFTTAPIKLFDKPFPTEKSLFKVGQKLEGIDPEHETLFCVMTIVETCGYRLKLHFDGYPAEYDFWVNVDCPDIFYTNWCKENNHTLQPPKGYKKEFNWDVYLHENGDCTPALRSYFVSTKNVCSVSSHSFKTGLKCEAVDIMTRTRTKPPLIYVGTIADVLGDRIRIHFDGWNDDYDYWTNITSTNIHPIGWCDNNNRTLCPPLGYNNLKGKKLFKWSEYLKETNSEAVPEIAFIRRPLREFTLNMAIEVVDIVAPSLMRIAVIIDIRENEIKILYDGFDRKYAYWIEDDSTNIHPIGWCLKTNHPLEIPPDQHGACKVVGCNGKGNINVLKSSHFAIKDCPYEFERWEKIVSRIHFIPDRLYSNDLGKGIKRKRSRRKKSNYYNKKRKVTKLNVILNEQKKMLMQNKSNENSSWSSIENI